MNVYATNLVFTCNDLMKEMQQGTPREAQLRMLLNRIRKILDQLEACLFSRKD